MFTTMANLPDPQLGKFLETPDSPGINVLPGSADDGWESPDPVSLGDGSTIQLYKDGEALRAAFEAIRLARHRICLEVYIFASDPTGVSFAQLLAQRAREGLLVHVMYDGFGSVASDGKMFDMMKAAGVRLREFHPFLPWRGRGSWHPLNRNHRKLLVIDNDLAWMGGLNIGSEYGGSWIHPSESNRGDFWRDTAIAVRGPAVRNYLAAFAKTWSYVQRRKRLNCAEYVCNLPFAPATAGRDQLGILASAPCRSSPLKKLLKKFVDGARRSLSMTMAYFAPHDELIEQLCRAARRGVRVRLMLPGRGDVKLLMIAARSFYETLLTAGVRIYERQHAVLHAKTMVADGRISVIGSTNLDYRSIEHNLELSTVVHSEALGAQMEALFENDIRYSRRILLSKWRHRPRSDRMVQWLVSRARYLL